MLKVLDLFSGIGGFSLGLERAGMETIAFCEIEEFPRKVLKKHWPGVPIFKDIRELHAEDLPEAVDVICGGFPCQPFSTAGNRRGSEDDRALWPEMLRIISEGGPSWVIGENVTGIIGVELDKVLFDLEGAGYEAQPLVIPACAKDAPHRRDRVWIIAHANSRRRNRDQEDEVRAGRNTSEPHFNPLADTLCNGSQRECLTGKDNGESKGEQPWGKASERINKEDREAWPDEPGVGRVADGVPNRSHRIKALGNAVVPQIPEIIGRAILAVESNLVRG